MQRKPLDQLNRAHGPDLAVPPPEVAGLGVIERGFARYVIRGLLILLSVAMCTSAAELPKTPLFGDGTFVGMEPMPHYHDPLAPKDQWFYENTLTIKGGDAILGKIPVSYYKGEKRYSVSDGGIYTYKGSVSFVDGHWRLELLLTESNYAPVAVDKAGEPMPPRPQQFTVRRMKDGTLLMDKVTYRRMKSK